MSCNTCKGQKEACCLSYWMQPRVLPLAIDEDLGGEYLMPSGPPSQTVVPHIHPDASVTLELWDGTTWTTSPLVIPPGGLYNYSLSFVPPSAITPNYSVVTAGALPDAWTTPVVTELVSNKFLVAGLIAGVATLKAYSPTLVSLSSTPLPGLPSLIAYNGQYVAVAGVTAVPGTYYLSIYGVDMGSGAFTLIKSYIYGINVTSISFTTIDTATPGVTTTHTALLVTTARYYLPGEIVTIPAPVISLATAPPGDIFLIDILPPISSYYPQEPALLWSYRYGGFLSASYSRKKGVIFALNETETVVTFSILWRCNGVMARLAPLSIPVPGANGVYVVDGVGFTNLLVYGDDRVIAYDVETIPW